MKIFFWSLKLPFLNCMSCNRAFNFLGNFLEISLELYVLYIGQEIVCNFQSPTAGHTFKNRNVY